MTRAGTLADTLRELSDEQLAQLLRARPDVLSPVPATFDELASRLGTRASLARALDDLDRAALAIVEAAVIAGPVPQDELRALTGFPEPRFTGLLDRLRAAGLAWFSDGAVQVPAGVGDLLGRYPAGLGPSVERALEYYDRERRERLAADLGVRDGSGTAAPAVLAQAFADPRQIEALFADAGPRAREAAEQLARPVPGGSPVGALAGATRVVTVDSARSPAEQLLARGLFIAVDDEHVVLPREVALVLRGGHLYDPADLEPPPMDAGRTHDTDRVERTAAGAALEVVRLVERALDAWAESPPAILRSDGLGVRDLRRTAKLLDVDESTAALLLECAREAELLGASDDDATWLPTPAYDTWLRAEPAHRWASLVAAWFTAIRAPGLVGTRDERDRVRSALSPEVERPSARRARRLVFEALDHAGPGVSPRHDDVWAYVRWAAPRWAGRNAEELVGQVLTEAGALGLTGLGALTEAGRALRHDTSVDPVADAVSSWLPEPVEQIVVQADLTAVAPGPLRPELARELALLADAESHGGATVFRFSEESVRRAFDHGRTAAELHQLLAQLSATPVPQPLSYLVDDVARRHGQLRVGTATTYLRCDDEAALTALLADRRASDLRLRQLAPTVLVSPVSVRTLLDALRDLGYSPVAEGPDGTVTVTAPRAGRTTETPRRRQLQELTAPEPHVVTAAARAIRAGDKARAARPNGATVGRLPRTASTKAIDALRAALADGQTVWVGYVDQHGGSSDRIVDPVRIEGGWLTAFDHTSGEARTFALHRITGATTVDESA